MHQINCTKRKTATKSKKLKFQMRHNHTLGHNSIRKTEKDGNRQLRTASIEIEYSRNRPRVIVLTLHSYVRNVENVYPNCLCSTRQKKYIIYLAEKSIILFFLYSMLFVDGALLWFRIFLFFFHFFQRDCCWPYCSFSFRFVNIYFFCPDLALCFWCRCYAVNDYHDDEWRRRPTNARNNVCVATRQQARWIYVCASVFMCNSFGRKRWCLCSARKRFHPKATWMEKGIEKLESRTHTRTRTPSTGYCRGKSVIRSCVPRYLFNRRERAHAPTE